METEGLSFPDAVERLAGMAGLPMPADAAGAAARGDKARDACWRCWRWPRAYSTPMLHEPVGARARGYLVRPRSGPRGAAAVLARLRGARAFRACATRWRHRGVGAEQMIEAGLLVHGEGHRRALRPFPRPGDVPDPRPRGRVIAFGGRAMEPGAKAKYLNSPETTLFHKGSLLFNHHRARKAAHDKRRGSSSSRAMST